MIFQTQITWSNRIHSLKYLRSATFGSKDIVIRKSEFVTKTQFFYRYREEQLNYLRTLIINVLSFVSGLVKLTYFNYFLLFIIFGPWIQKYCRFLWCNVNKHNAELCLYSSQKLLPMVIKEKRFNSISSWFYIEWNKVHTRGSVLAPERNLIDSEDKNIY